MISSAIALLLAVAAQQVIDPAAKARDAFTGCLNKHMQDSLDSRTAPEAFDQSVVQACATERDMFRNAVIQREQSFGESRAAGEEYAEIEIEDARANTRELYRLNHEAGTRPQ